MRRGAGYGAFTPADFTFRFAAGKLVLYKADRISGVHKDYLSDIQQIIMSSQCNPCRNLHNIPEHSARFTLNRNIVDLSLHNMKPHDLLNIQQKIYEGDTYFVNYMYMYIKYEQAKRKST